ncbi:MAG: fumarate hydratase, partial [Acidobacteriales bacterium]
SVSGKNSGNNLGVETPVLHWEQWEEDEIEIKLILKGGGCENMNSQYSVPCELAHLGRADRNLEGVRKCILHAVWQAQGFGCAPGAIGVCIGGDRAHGYHLAKMQLFRTLDDVNRDPALAVLEAEILEEANRIGVGAMGFGGRASLIGCKIAAANRIPASFFVSVAYDCWAFRRLGVRLDAASGAITKWLYRDPERPVERMAATEHFPLTGREIILDTPLSEEAVRALKVGDVVLLNGEMYTGRDQVHSYLMKHAPPVDLRGAALYHCGPVMLKQGDGWVTKAAGPTTSVREEPYQHHIIRACGVRAVIGKGGMGEQTLAAMKDAGAVYLHAIGGAAQVYARAIERVLGVHLLEFGIPEAMWHLQVKNFLTIVTMDAHGNSLHAAVEAETGAALEALRRG